MRHFVTFALALLVSFTMVDSAEAKKPKKVDEATPAQVENATDVGPTSAGPLEVSMTGIADVDAIFQKAIDPLNNLKAANNALANLNTNLVTALGLPAGTPIADAIADLKTKAEGKITLAMNEKGMPALSPSDAVPANVQKAIDAVNDGVSQAQIAGEKLTELPSQVKEVVAAAMGITPQTLMASGVKPMEAPKQMKTIQSNLKMLGTAPDQAKAFTDQLTSTVSTLKSTFAP